jgi:hypothetical protein
MSDRNEDKPNSELQRSFEPLRTCFALLSLCSEFWSACAFGTHKPDEETAMDVCLPSDFLALRASVDSDWRDGCAGFPGAQSRASDARYSSPGLPPRKTLRCRKCASKTAHITQSRSRLAGGQEIAKNQLRHSSEGWNDEQTYRLDAAAICAYIAAITAAPVRLAENCRAGKGVGTGARDSAMLSTRRHRPLQTRMLRPLRSIISRTRPVFQRGRKE